MSRGSLGVTMTRNRHYPVHSHDGMVTIPRWEYDSLREIAKLHQKLLDLVEQKLPEVRGSFKGATGK